MAADPVDRLLRVGTVALHAEVVLAVVGEVALRVGAEARRAGTFGQRSRVRHSQRDGADGVLNDIQVLEAGGGRLLGREAEARGDIGASAVDCLVS